MTMGKKTVGLLTLAMAFSLAAGAAVISNGAANAADAGETLRAEATHAAPLSASGIMPIAFPEGSEYKHGEGSHSGWEVLEITANPQGVGDAGVHFVEPDADGKYYIDQFGLYSPDNVTYYDPDNTVSADIILCLNGHKLDWDEPLIIKGNVHICDCAEGEGITCDIVVKDGSLELEGVKAKSVAVDGGKLIVSGDTTIESVTLSDDSIIECGELTGGAKIEIVADENGDRKAPYVHTENEDDLNYFHVSDDSDPAATKVGVTLDFPEDITYNGENRLNDMKGGITVKNLSTDTDLSYGGDYTIQVNGETLSGTTEMIKAGTYHVQVVLAEGKHYELDEAGSDEDDYMISPHTVEVNVSDNSKTYNGEEQEPTITVTGVPGHFSESDYTVSYSMDEKALDDKPKDAGTYGIVINFHGEAATNYQLPEKIAAFTIEKAGLTVNFPKELDATYNGLDQRDTLKSGEYISFEGMVNEEVIAAGDYEIAINTSTNNDTTSMTKAGTYTAEVKLSDTAKANNYTLTGEATHTYTVKKANLTVSGNGSATYNGKGQAPISLTGAAADASFKENNESNGYTVTYAPKNGEQTDGQKPKGAGSYNVTFTLRGDAAINYERPGDETFTIEKATITVNFTALYDAVYSGSDRLGDIKSSHVSFVGTYEDLSADDYEVTISSSSNGDKNSMTKVGTYTVNVALSSSAAAKNYTLTGNTTHDYTIEKADLKVSVSGPVTYNGKEQTPAIIVTGVSGALTEGGESDYTVTYGGGQLSNGKPKGAGTYTVTVTLRGDAAINYNAPKAEAFTIEKARLSVEIGSGTEYDGEDHAQDILDAVKAAIERNGTHPEESEYTVTIDGKEGTEVKNVKAGGYLVVVTLRDGGETNYQFGDGDKTLTLTYTVEKATVGKPTEDTKKFTYNGGDQTYSVQGGGSEYFRVEGNTKREANESGYTVTVILNDPANYMWAGEEESSEPLTFSFKIARAPVTVIWSGGEADHTYTYGKVTAPSAEVQGKFGSDDVSVTAETKDGAFRNAGTYSYTAVLQGTAAKNYFIRTGET